MISKRAVTAAAVAATAAVLLASGDAYACSIGDFTAKATCDTSTGEARAAITITDKDPSGTPADITVRIRMAVGTDGETVGTGHIDHPTAAGASTTILVPWLQGYQWNVSVTAGNLVDERLTDLPISPDTPCVPATSPRPAPRRSGRPLGVADRRRHADLAGRRAVGLDVLSPFDVRFLARCGDQARRDRRRQRHPSDRRIGRRGDRRRHRRAVRHAPPHDGRTALTTDPRRAGDRGRMHLTIRTAPAQRPTRLHGSKR
ncbi:hypothetical protein O1M63_47250 [Streptomyces mirabilis]|nr:hypothetical protein [Streptomyces mirabilis]